MITFTPANEEHFNIKIERLIAALQHANRKDAFESQFCLLLHRLTEWLKDRSCIESAFITLHDRCLAFIVVRTSVEHDNALTAELADLDIDIASDVDLDLIPLHTLLIPSVSSPSLGSFLNPDFVFEYARGS
jgi:hypothetical protein